MQIQGTGYGLIGAVSDLRITLAAAVVGIAGANAGTVLNPQINRTGLTAANLANTFYIGSINSSSTPVTGNTDLIQRFTKEPGSRSEMGNSH